MNLNPLVNINPTYKKPNIGEKSDKVDLSDDQSDQSFNSKDLDERNK